MSTLNKARIFIFPVVWILLSVPPAAGMDADEAPAGVTIDYLQELYEAVNFDHLLHTGMYQCDSCHHHTTGTGTRNESCKKCHAASGASDQVACSGCHDHNKTSPLAISEETKEGTGYHIDKPGLKGALHLQCLGCHRVDDGPTGCEECHGFTAAGRKRFALKN
jgi:hypothetical protein